MNDYRFHVVQIHELIEKSWFLNPSLTCRFLSPHNSQCIDDITTNSAKTTIHHTPQPKANSQQPTANSHNHDHNTQHTTHNTHNTHTTHTTYHTYHTLPFQLVCVPEYSCLIADRREHTTPHHAPHLHAHKAYSAPATRFNASKHLSMSSAASSPLHTKRYETSRDICRQIFLHDANMLARQGMGHGSCILALRATHSWSHGEWEHEQVIIVIERRDIDEKRLLKEKILYVYID